MMLAKIMIVEIMFMISFEFELLLPDIKSSCYIQHSFQSQRFCHVVSVVFRQNVLVMLNTLASLRFCCGSCVWNGGFRWRTQ